ncbi:MAG: Uncharacterised protein [Bacteroidetes bacterium MED-G17]|nr:MAG: Uncharacterised protein [Bacteroidetes bacterium MED-G17]
MKLSEEQMNREKLELEFEVRSSPSVLFNYLSTPSGLVEWFCDDVNLKGKDKFIFIWEGEERVATLQRKVSGKYIKWSWDDEEESEFFEFSINRDELTGDIALIITDFADEDEVEEMELLWESQVQDLRNALGV